VHQILDVLIENSLRHGEGLIVLSAADRGTYVEIGVGDRGQRPPDQSIFARAVRSDSSRGEGIGLAVAKELAEAIDGHLLLAPSTTTTFMLMLAKAPTSAAAPASSKPI